MSVHVGMALAGLSFLITQAVGIGNGASGDSHRGGLLGDIEILLGSIRRWTSARRTELGTDITAAVTTTTALVTTTPMAAPTTIAEATALITRYHISVICGLAPRLITPHRGVIGAPDCRFHGGLAARPPFCAIRLQLKVNRMFSFYLRLRL